MTEEMYKDYEDRLKQLCTRFFLPEFKEFACEVLLNKYKPTNIVSLVQYDENIDRAYFLLYNWKQRKMYNPLNLTKQSDSAVMAILLHDLFFDGKVENWKDVFNARMELAPIAGKYITSDSYDAFEYTWRIIEAQLGEDMPIIACRPVSGQITSTIWEFLWYWNHSTASHIYIDEIENGGLL